MAIVNTIDHIVIGKSPGETRVALMSSGRMIEVFVERAGAASLVGNIYLGRVVAAVRKLEAAFVDIGTGQDGFLALREARPPDVSTVGGAGDGIGDYLNEGDAVVVQVQRDPVEDKGAKLTTRITLAGTGLIFRPHQPGVSISRRIADAGDRERLTRLVEGLVEGLEPDGAAQDCGFIVRTAAAEAGAEAIEADAARLIRRWRKIRHARANCRAPAALYAGPGPACRALRDFGGPGIRKIIADDAEVLAEVRAFCEAEAPAWVSLIERHDGAEDLFEAFRAEEQIDAALSPVVGLAGGGSLIISQTPALCAIDVNTEGADGGSRSHTALAVNLEAATEAARQIRLRNLSGLIVVDFVPLRDDARKRQILDALREACAADPLGPHVVGYTRLGLVEMTRPRHGLSLLDVIGVGLDGGVRAPVKSPLSQALEALRAVLRQGPGHGGAAQVTLRASRAVIGALADPNGPGPAALKETEERLGLAITLIPEQTLAAGGYDIVVGKAE